MKPQRPAAALLTALSCALCLGALAGEATPTTSAVEQRIERIQAHMLSPVMADGELAGPTLAERMATLRVPGVSIAVIRDGQIEWARGFGVTTTGGGGTAITPNTLFQAASISKPVSALAVLRLVESGKVDLDTNVNQYLKTWKLAENEFTANAKVTLRGLLSHTAGITVHGFPGYAPNGTAATVRQILDGQPPANTARIFVDTTPGTLWRYSGGGYVVAQQLVEDVTGQPFAQLMRDSVLLPIGMTRSTFEQPLPAARLGEVAAPHRVQGQPLPEGPHTYPEMAPAGLWTTPSDLALFAIEIQKAVAGKSTVLSADRARQMLTPVKNNYGLGPGTGGKADRPYFTHGGSNAGYQSLLVAYNNGDGAVVMTNGDNGGQLAAELIRTIAFEYKWPDFAPTVRKVVAVDPKLLDTYVGAYQFGANAVMTVTRDADKLFTQLTGQGKVEMRPVSDREFAAMSVDARITFEVDTQGKVSQLVLHQNGQNRPAPRMDDAAGAQILAARAAVDRRIAEQKADPRSEAVLRRFIGELWRGEPDYTQLMPGFANAVRQQLPAMQGLSTQLGALQSLAFQAVGVAGEDVYVAKFTNGGIEFRLLLTADGKIESAGFRAQ
jgi:CubicO group peptidase (beta-lactamase class C family)